MRCGHVRHGSICVWFCTVCVCTSLPVLLQSDCSFGGRVSEYDWLIDWLIDRAQNRSSHAYGRSGCYGPATTNCGASQSKCTCRKLSSCMHMTVIRIWDKMYRHNYALHRNCGSGYPKPYIMLKQSSRHAIHGLWMLQCSMHTGLAHAHWSDMDRLSTLAVFYDILQPSSLRP